MGLRTFRSALPYTGGEIGWLIEESPGGQTRVSVAATGYLDEAATALGWLGVKVLTDEGDYVRGEWTPELDERVVRLIDGLIYLRDCHPTLVQLTLLDNHRESAG